MSSSNNDLLLELNARMSRISVGDKLSAEDLGLAKTLNFSDCAEDSLVEMLKASIHNLSVPQAISIFEGVCENESVSDALRAFPEFREEFESTAGWASGQGESYLDTQYERDDGHNIERDPTSNESDIGSRLCDLSDTMEEILEKTSKPLSRAETTDLFWRAARRKDLEGYEGPGPLRDIGHDLFD